MLTLSICPCHIFFYFSYFFSFFLKPQYFIQIVYRKKIIVMDLLHHYMVLLGGRGFLKNMSGLFMPFNCWSSVYIMKEFKIIYYSCIQNCIGHDWTVLSYPAVRLCDFVLWLLKRLILILPFSYLAVWYRALQTATFHIRKRQ